MQEQGALFSLDEVYRPLRPPPVTVINVCDNQALDTQGIGLDVGVFECVLS